MRIVDLIGFKLFAFDLNKHFGEKAKFSLKRGIVNKIPQAYEAGKN